MNIRRGFLALAAMILCVGFFSAPAMAAGCGGGAIDVEGDYIAEHTGDCELSSITAGGNVFVTATGKITIGDISAGGEVYLEAQGGNTQAGSITSANGGSIVIYSNGSTTTNSLESDAQLTLFQNGNVTINGTASFAWGMVAEGSGDINVTGAITGTGSGHIIQLSAFDLGHKITLGGNITAPGYGIGLNAGSTISTKSINTNGTTSYLDVRFFPNQSGGNAAFLLGDGGTNGVDGSVTATRTTGNSGVIVDNPGTGGVELDGAKINVQSSAGASGEIFVKAPNGPVKVKGHLSVNGATGQRAGHIILISDTLVTTGGAQISSDDTVTANHNHYVVLTGSNLTYTGGLTLSVKGNTSSGLYLMAKGSQSLTIPTDVSEPIFPGSPNAQRAAVTVTSTDSNKLTMNVDGRDNRVILHAYPMTFSGGPIDINADRSNVYFQYAGAAANNNSLVFNGGTVNVFANSSIAGEHAGKIHMWVDRLGTPVPAINLYASEGKDGGTVEIIAANGTIPVGDGTGKIKIEANAGVGNGGKGGTVTIYGQVQDLNDQDSILAKGDGSGEGGNVTITQASGNLDPATQGINVPVIIRVDGGGSRVPGDSYGSISLNYVTCKQWKTNAATYPRFAWDCITPDTGANIATLVTAGASLSSTLQLDLAVLNSPLPANPAVGVYAMNQLYDFESFFGKPHVGPYSAEFGRSSVSWLRVSATFATSGGTSNATISGSPTIMVAALVHELGHHLDYIFGPGLQNLSSQTAWKNLIAPDFATMDGMPCNAVFFAATCSTYPSITNSQRFRLRFPGLFDPPAASGAVREYEFFAHMFEHVESFLTGNPPSYQSEPELEKAMDTMVQLKAYMSNLIASPPSPVK